MQIQQADNKYRSAIIALLEEEKLPVADLPAMLDNFYTALVNGVFAGVAGLEIYGKYGLVRSLVVDKASRDKGIANALLARIEALAADKKLSEIYLLTETAPDYFVRKGYHKITRDGVPVEVLQSAEFSYLCPQSAVVMKKSMNQNYQTYLNYKKMTTAGKHIQRKILFVCIHNSARSQMAEAFLKKYGSDFFEAESAGLEPGKLNPNVVKVIGEIGIDISKNDTQSVFDLFKGGKLYNAVITVCDGASAESCPIFPGLVKRLGWSFPDPSAFKGTDEEILEQTRKVRDEIKETVLAFIEEARHLEYWTK
jgi:arsenate reductase (thioredoxin)